MSEKLLSFFRPHPRVTAPHSDDLVTKQQFKAECDINTILKQYSKTGILNHVNNATPSYQDLPDDIDYQRSMNVLIQADEAFLSLPAVVRSRYGNDPQTFLAALSDPAQKEYLTEVGVFAPPAPVGAPPEPVRPPLPAPPVDGV